MSDTTETATAPEPQLLGGTSAEQIAAYQEALKQADSTYNQNSSRTDTLIGELHSTLNKLYGTWNDRNDAVMGMVNVLNAPMIQEYANRRDQAKAAARKELAKDADPMTLWLLTTGQDEYGEYTKGFLALLPATVEQFNAYATNEGLCTVYENAARKIHDSVEGGYFTDTRTVSKRLRYWESVPVEFGGSGTEDADEGDDWEIVAVLPAFYRDKWVNGAPTEMIIRRAVSFSYRKIVTTPDSNEG